MKTKSYRFAKTYVAVLILLVGLALSGCVSAKTGSSPDTIQGGERKVFESDGLKIEAFVFGSGAETLFMAGGLARPATDLETIAKRVAAQGVQVVTYNYRGIGSSTGSLDKLTIHDFADDVWRLVDAMGIENLHLAGKTYGNRVMRAASAGKPNRVKSIILIGAGGEIMPSKEVIAMYHRMHKPGIPKEEWLELHAKLNFSPVNAHLAHLSLGGGTYPKVGRVQMATIKSTPLTEYSQGGTAPLLVIQGLDDVVAIPQNSLNLALSRRNTWLVGIPNCGHNMVFEQPEELTRLIVDFIRLH